MPGTDTNIDSDSAGNAPFEQSGKTPLFDPQLPAAFFEDIKSGDSGYEIAKKSLLRCRQVAGQPDEQRHGSKSEGCEQNMKDAFCFVICLIHNYLKQGLSRSTTP